MLGLTLYAQIGMAYSTSLDQKRRETLRRQLYGKEVITPKAQKTSADKSTHSAFSYTNVPESSVSQQTLTSDYLNRDLTRILIYSSIAVAMQLALFFAINSHLVRLPI